MSIKLRDLIRAVRACKTAAEERAVISKECALIRTAIKEEDEQYRARNVAKLMYIHMLGYPTHFGQMECLKLISAQSFNDKRIGYLALTLLLNEQAEVLTLVTNSLKIDLNSPNQFIQALSLIAIGNLATQDMARDLISDVEKLLTTNNSYIRKKAALATIRLIKKERDLIYGIENKILLLLKDKNHGVLLTGITLIIEILHEFPSFIHFYSKIVSIIIRLLKNFMTSSFNAEYEINGIMDPFLQVKLLELLRVLGSTSYRKMLKKKREGEDDEEQQYIEKYLKQEELSEKEIENNRENINDVLIQIATQVNTQKNCGNAILYECIKTILAIDADDHDGSSGMKSSSDSDSKVLAINLIGNFLVNNDNNIKYIGLQTLSSLIHIDSNLIQRHNNIIRNCLKDSDKMIQFRAVELLFHLINPKNFVTISTDIINYFIIAPTDYKSYIIKKFVSFFSMVKGIYKWKIDTILIFFSVFHQMDSQTKNTYILLLSSYTEYSNYLVHKLFQLLIDDFSIEYTSLFHLTAWAIGEYGEFLLVPYSNSLEKDSFNARSEAEVIQMLQKIIKIHSLDVTIKNIILTSLVKLSVKYTSPASIQSIRDIISSFTSSMNVELQQRATEYSILLSNSHYNELRTKLFQPIPVSNRVGMTAGDEASLMDAGLDTSSSLSLPSSSSAPVVSTSKTPSLLDLDDIFSSNASITPTPASNIPIGGSLGGGLDLLNDIFSSNLTLSPTPSATLAPTPPVMPTSVFPPAAPLAATPLTSTPLISTPTSNVPIFDKDGIVIVMDLTKPNPMDNSQTKVLLKFFNNNSFPINSFTFQAAVPKYLTLSLLSPSSSSLSCSPFSSGIPAATQEINLINTMQDKKNIMLKYKFLYKKNDQDIEDIGQISNFPNLY